MKRIFVTGISTEVGKTIASAIIVEALEADYWKPIQAGDVDYGDRHRVSELISNTKSMIYPNSFELNTPMSPHAAAEIDAVELRLDKIRRPVTQNHLVIEGAGGILVPLNDSDTILDLIQDEDIVIVVSRHYLGSINHTLLTIAQLQEKGHRIALIFSGDKNSTTERIILKKTGVPCIGRIAEETHFDKAIIKNYANSFKTSLHTL